MPPIANFDGDGTDGIVPNSTVPVIKIKKGESTCNRIF